MNYWIAADVKSEDGRAWELIGVFSSSALADAACTKPNHCYWSGVLDEILSEESVIPPDVRYPRHEESS